MQIKKSNDAKIEPCSTPASTLVQKEYCQCKTTLCFLLFKRILRRLLVTPFYFNLKTRTSCLLYDMFGHIKKNASDFKTIIKILIYYMSC